MRITEIITRKYNHGFIVVFDISKSLFIRSKKTFLDCDLYVGMDLEPEDMEIMIQTDIINYLKERALDYLSRRSRSKKEISDYLDKKIIAYQAKVPKKLQITEHKQLSNKVIGFLSDRKYFDDKDFAKRWVENRSILKKRSKHALRSELFQKGIKKELIDQEIANLTDTRELANAIHFGNKKKLILSSKSIDVQKQKVCNYLLQKGFMWDIINQVMKVIF